MRYEFMSRQLLANSQRMLKTFENANRTNTENTSGVRVREQRDARIFPSLYLNMTASRLQDIQENQMFENSFSRVINKREEPVDVKLMGNYPSDDTFES